MNHFAALRALRDALAGTPEHADGVAALDVLLVAVDAGREEAQRFAVLEEAFLRGGLPERCSPEEYALATERHIRKIGEVEAVLDSTRPAFVTMRERLAGVLELAAGVAALGELLDATDRYNEEAGQLAQMEATILRGKPRNFTVEQFMLAREHFREADRRKQEILWGKS